MSTTSPPKSSIYRTAERAVGNLPEYLATQRENGLSYGAISSALQDKNVLVTAETVRSWAIRLGIEVSGEQS
jgi:transposase-like protein